jgi:hypothetical protein
MLEDHIEIKSVARLVTPEEYSISGVREIGMNLERVEMVGNVETADREPNRILVGNFEILRYARV